MDDSKVEITLEPVRKIDHTCYLCYGEHDLVNLVLDNKSINTRTILTLCPCCLARLRKAINSK